MWRITCNTNSPAHCYPSEDCPTGGSHRQAMNSHAPRIYAVRGNNGLRGEKLNEGLLDTVPVLTVVTREASEYFKDNTSADIPISMVWVAHKAVIRGVLIREGSKRKKITADTHNTLMKELTELEAQNKLKPSKILTKHIGELQSELYSLSLITTERWMRSLKLTYYTQGNKAGRLLANKLKAKQLQSKIPFINLPCTTQGTLSMN
ncbi:Hypothetical predicted protein [Pelobates cultripes]|uniref:Uncharacterized protein n=1 Tax=Pelobates cultripes TaxID=61616 RepID=A0AAD1VTG6_PELCU|nr:Hypothetical predicted protein [Pelobates cultripes]